MHLTVSQNPDELGKAAAKKAGEVLNKAIEKNGKARIVFSTGASQNETLAYLLREKVDWRKVEVFHLDEYIDLPLDHPASFRRYLKNRFLRFVEIGGVHFVNTEGEIAKNIATLTAEIRKAPIDLALIGIGENGHIAFNDPPADFETEDAYIAVTLDEVCKRQQVGEGSFTSVEEVPKQAVSMSVYQIMLSHTIISSVPDKRKATAVKHTLERDVTNQVPATMLKRHDDWYLYLDEESAAEIEHRP